MGHNGTTVEDGKTISRNKLLLFLLSVYIVLSCLSPKVGFIGHLEINLDDFLLLVIVFVSFMISAQMENIQMPPQQIVAAFWGLLLVLLLSTLYSSLTKYQLISMDGVIHEIARLFKYFLIFIAFWFAGRCGRWKETLTKIFIYSSLIVVVIGFMQTVNLFGINEVIYRYYKPMWATDPTVRLLGIQRVASTFFNPNVLGVFLLMPFAICISRAMLHQNRIRNTILSKISRLTQSE